MSRIHGPYLSNFADNGVALGHWASMADRKDAYDHFQVYFGLDRSCTHRGDSS